MMLSGLFALGSAQQSVSNSLTIKLLAGQNITSGSYSILNKMEKDLNV